jgi:hypothetical protein
VELSAIIFLIADNKFQSLIQLVSLLCCLNGIYCDSHFVHLTSDGLELLKERNILSEPVDILDDDDDEEDGVSTPSKIASPQKATPQKASPQKASHKEAGPSSLGAEYKASLPEHVRWLLEWALQTDPEAIKSLKVSHC